MNAQQLDELHRLRKHHNAQHLAKMFGVSLSTIYYNLRRQKPQITYTPHLAKKNLATDIKTLAKATGESERKINQDRKRIKAQTLDKLIKEKRLPMTQIARLIGISPDKVKERAITLLGYNPFVTHNTAVDWSQVFKDAQTMPITVVCDKHNIARATYYRKLKDA